MPHYGLSVEVTRDTATPEIVRLQRLMQSVRMRQAIGRAARNEVHQNLVDYDRKHPNALGGRRTHIMARAGRSAQFKVLPNGVRVSISNEAIAQRYFGGDIHPRLKKRLAIPARREAYGRSPRSFHNLRIVMFATGTLALVERESTDIVRDRRKGRTGFRSAGRRGGGVMYWLVESVNQKGDKRVLPTYQRLLTAAEFGARQLLERQPK